MDVQAQPSELVAVQPETGMSGVSLWLLVWSGQSDAIHVVCMGLDRGPENDQTELRLLGLSRHVWSEAVGSELARPV